MVNTTSPTSWNVEQKTFISGGEMNYLAALQGNLTRIPTFRPSGQGAFRIFIQTIIMPQNQIIVPRKIHRLSLSFIIFHLLQYTVASFGWSPMSPPGWFYKFLDSWNFHPTMSFAFCCKKTKSKGWNHLGRFEASFFFCDTGSKW